MIHATPPAIIERDRAQAQARVICRDAEPRVRESSAFTATDPRGEEAPCVCVRLLPITWPGKPDIRCDTVYGKGFNDRLWR